MLIMIIICYRLINNDAMVKIEIKFSYHFMTMSNLLLAECCMMMNIDWFDEMKHEMCLKYADDDLLMKFQN